MISCCGGDWAAVAVDEVFSIFFSKSSRAAQFFENTEGSINSLLSRFATQVVQMFAGDLSASGTHSGAQISWLNLMREYRHEKRDHRGSARGFRISCADEASHARDRADLERQEHAHRAPFERAGDLHRGERSLGVVAEHDAIDHEDERLQQRVRDGRQREPPNFIAQRRSELHTMSSPKRFLRVMLAASVAQLSQ